MKTFLHKQLSKTISLLVIFMVVFASSKAQTNWCPAGATWYYDYNAFFTTGYYKIQYTGDTVINSITCKKLSKTIYSYSAGNTKLDTTYLKNEYTYADANKVYVFRLNNFYTLYDFSANVGDTIIIAGTNKYTSSCDSVGAVKVDSVGTMTINGQSLRYISVNPTATSKWGWKCRIVEKIGAILNFANGSAFSYLFPNKLDYCGLAVDEYPEGGSLRCYQDNIFGSYSSGTSASCNYIATGINELTGLSSFSVYPNPTTGSLTLTLSKGEGIGAVKIYNVLGECVLYQQLITNNQQLTLDVSSLPAGIYFVQLKTENENATRKIIMQ